MLNCTVEIMRNSDGVIRHDKDGWEWDVERKDSFDVDSFFLWSDGNFACDCNRAMFFAHAGGDPDPSVSCGMALYSVQIRDPNGLVVYKDGKFDDDEVTPAPED